MPCLAKRGAISRSIAWISSCGVGAGEIVEHAGGAIEPVARPLQRFDGIGERRLPPGCRRWPRSPACCRQSPSNAGMKCFGSHAIERRHLERRRPFFEQRVLARAVFRLRVRNLGGASARRCLLLSCRRFAALARHRAHPLACLVWWTYAVFRGIVETGDAGSRRVQQRSVLHRLCHRRGEPAEPRLDVRHSRQAQDEIEHAQAAALTYRSSCASCRRRRSVRRR